jgi:hypothetical protein
MQQCSKLQDRLNEIQHKNLQEISSSHLFIYLLIYLLFILYQSKSLHVCLECFLVSYTNKVYFFNATPKMQLPIPATSTFWHKGLKTRPADNAISKFSSGCTRIYQRQCAITQKYAHNKPVCNTKIKLLTIMKFWLLLKFNNYIICGNSSVCIETGYRLGGPGIESWCGRDISYRRALGPTQPLVQRVPGLSQG